MSIQVKKRVDYRAPVFTITDVNMDVRLHPTQTRVSSTFEVKRNGEHDLPLTLDGDHLTLISLTINDTPHTDYQETPGQLVVNQVPDTFSLTIVTHIDPQHNQALEGLYLSGGTYCTQCEAEGFRRITYYLDRPDVLARFQVTLHGDKDTYPTLLANGNPIARGNNDDGTHWVTWQDPHPKPAYLFALVAGDFDLLEDTFTTMSGKQVKLELDKIQNRVQCLETTTFFYIIEEHQFELFKKVSLYHLKICSHCVGLVWILS